MIPRPAASVVLVRASAPGAPEPLEVYMIRRRKGMRFLGGFYAFPGGKLDPGDAAPAILDRCHGVTRAEALARLAPHTRPEPLAFWVTALRELLEESGMLLACDEHGTPLDARRPETAAGIDACRRALMAGEAPLAALLARAGWRLDLRPLRYLAHYVTPRSSSIRYAARFFLALAPADQAPRLFTEETSEGFWIHPGEGHRRFLAGDMAMAEPAEYSLGYLAQFRSVEELWAAHADGAAKYDGIIHRIEFWKGFDWKAARWPDGAPGPAR